MTLEQLPPKGVKREQAILELGKDEANGELLFQLVNTEKGKCKTAAQKALAQLEYAPAAPLWAKLVKGKWMGSNIMSDACSDCVSEQIAPVILKTLSQLLGRGGHKATGNRTTELLFHLMLGKASPKMLEVYRFLAENMQADRPAETRSQFILMMIVPPGGLRTASHLGCHTQGKRENSARGN